MNRPPLVCAAWSLDAPEFIVPLLTGGNSLVTVVPPPSPERACHLIVPRIPAASKMETIDIGCRSKLRTAKELNEIVKRACADIGITAYPERLEAISTSLEMSALRTTIDDSRTREALLRGMYSVFNISPKILQFDHLEDTGYRTAKRLQDIDDLCFRGRGRVIASLKQKKCILNSIRATSDQSTLRLTGVGGSFVIDVGRDDFLDGTVKILLRGSIRPISLESAGVFGHAPWHSQFHSGNPPKGMLSYRATRVVSPMWQRYECDARHISDNWCEGALVSDYVHVSERASQYVSQVLGLDGRPLSMADVLKLRRLAMATHGRRWRVQNDRRVEEILKEYRAIGLTNDSERSKVPLLASLDDYVTSSNFNGELKKAILILLKILEGPLRMSLLMAFILIEKERIAILRSTSTTIAGHVLLPTKRRRL